METVCWQYRVKQTRAAEDPQRPDLTGIAPAVVEISQIEAREFIVNYEWLGNAGASRYCYGLMYKSHFAAVVCFSRPTSPVTFASLLGPSLASKTYQLCRGASAHWAPKHAPSMLIGESLRKLEERTGARVVVAYADPEAGEIGTIYQATNAIYLGLTDSRGPGKYIIRGKHYHPRSVHRQFGSARHDVLVRLDPNYVRHQRTKKHRYIYILGPRCQRNVVLQAIGSRVCAYPKRSLGRVNSSCANG